MRTFRSLSLDAMEVGAQPGSQGAETEKSPPRRRMQTEREIRSSPYIGVIQPLRHSAGKLFRGISAKLLVNVCI